MRQLFNSIFIVVLLFTQSEILAQQTEIEFDSDTVEPHLLLTETGAGSSFSRIRMENQLAGWWTLAARNGTSSDFNIFYNDGTSGLNYLNIDPNNDLTTIITDLEIDNKDIIISGTDPDIFLRSDGTTDPGISFGDNGFSNDGRIWYDSDIDVMKFGTTTSFVGDINVNAFGKVGIDIDRFSSTEALNAQMTIRANAGNTVTPAHLELYENNNSGFPNIYFTNFGLSGFWEVQARSEGSATSDGFFHFIHSNNGTTTDEIMTLNGSEGFVGINDATPEYTMSIDHGAGSPSTGSDHGLNIEQTSTNTAWTLYTRTSNGGDLQFFHEANTSNATTPILRATIDSSNGAYTSSSDRRLKKNISSLENQLEKVMQLHPTRYQFKTQDDDSYSLGLIAQEVQNVIPEIVTQLASEEEDEVSFLGVSYTELIPVLIGAIQEQQEIIDLQKKQIAQNSYEMEAFKASIESKLNKLVNSAIKASLDEESKVSAIKTGK